MKKITIVEDDHSILEMYRLKFEFGGFEVSEAHDGKEGLEVIEREKPDLILLDLMMPNMTGEEMLGALREKPWGKLIPVIVMTNVSQNEAPTTLKNLNVSDYIVKANSTPQHILERANEIL